jgi:hypothetical protein
MINDHHNGSSASQSVENGVMGFHQICLIVIWALR